MAVESRTDFINRIIRIYDGIASKRNELNSRNKELMDRTDNNSLEIRKEINDIYFQLSNVTAGTAKLSEQVERLVSEDPEFKKHLYFIMNPNAETDPPDEFERVLSKFSVHNAFMKASEEQKHAFLKDFSDDMLLQFDAFAQNARLICDSREELEIYRTISKEDQEVLVRLEEQLKGDPRKDEILADLRVKLSTTSAEVRTSIEAYADQLEKSGRYDKERCSEERYRTDDRYRRMLDSIACSTNGNTESIFENENLERTGRTVKETIEMALFLMKENHLEVMKNKHPQQDSLRALCQYIYDNLLPENIDNLKSGEQAVKVYGLARFMDKTKELRNELDKNKKEFDLNKINRLRDEYDAELEKYMKALRMAKPICDSTTSVLGNIGNMRAGDTPDQILKMPRENELVNGLYLAAVMAKQMNVTPGELFEDPKRMWVLTQERLQQTDPFESERNFGVNGETNIPGRLPLRDESISPYRAVFDIFQSRHPKPKGVALMGCRAYSAIMYLQSDKDRFQDKVYKDVCLKSDFMSYDHKFAIQGMTDRLMFAQPGDKMGKLGRIKWDYDNGNWVGSDDFNTQEKAKVSLLVYGTSPEQNSRAVEEAGKRMADLFLAVSDVLPVDAEQSCRRFVQDRGLLGKKMLGRASENMERLCRIPERARISALAEGAKKATDSILAREELQTGRRFRNRWKVKQLVNVWNAVKNSELKTDPDALAQAYQKIRDGISDKRLSCFRFLSGEYWAQKRMIDQMDAEYKEMQSTFRREQELEDAGQKDYMRQLEHLENSIAPDGGISAKAILSFVKAVPKDVNAEEEYVNRVFDTFVTAQNGFFNGEDYKNKNEALSCIRALSNGIFGNETNRALIENAIGKKNVEEIKGWNNCMDIMARGIAQRKALMKPNLTSEERRACVTDILLGEMVKGSMDIHSQKDDKLPKFEPGSMQKAFAKKEEMESFLREQIENSVDFNGLMNLPDKKLIQQLCTDRVHTHAGAVLGQEAEKITEKVNRLGGGKKQASNTAKKIAQKSIDSQKVTVGI